MVQIKLDQSYMLVLSEEELKIVSMALRFLSARAVDPTSFGPPHSEDIKLAGMLNLTISQRKEDALSGELAITKGVTRFLADFVKQEDDE